MTRFRWWPSVFMARHSSIWAGSVYALRVRSDMKAFNATLRPGQTDIFIGADLPGVGYSLNFFLGRRPVHLSRPHAGRVVESRGI
jgi:hypothetical protein